MQRHFFQAVESDLQKVTELIGQTIDTDNRVLYQAARHFVEASGKQMRPALVLLAGKCCDARMPDNIIRTAAALEFLHMASLVHDDIVDQAERRRGVVTVNEHWGNKVAVLLGDYFYGKALHQAVQCGLSVVELMAEIIDGLVSGEWLQVEEADDLSISEECYFQRIEMKTARFISASCRLGALAVGASDEMREALTGYGRNLGMAYQIQDDILDIIGDEQKTGKPTCVDLGDGHITLPIIHALREGGYRQEFLALLQSKVYDQPARQRISFWLQDGGSIEYASLTAHKFIVNAKACLGALPGGIVNQALHNIADFACQRVY